MKNNIKTPQDLFKFEFERQEEIAQDQELSAEELAAIFARFDKWDAEERAKKEKNLANG